MIYRVGAKKRADGHCESKKVPATLPVADGFLKFLHQRHSKKYVMESLLKIQPHFIFPSSWYLFRPTVAVGSFFCLTLYNASR